MGRWCWDGPRGCLWWGEWRTVCPDACPFVTQIADHRETCRASLCRRVLKAESPFCQLPRATRSWARRWGKMCWQMRFKWLCQNYRGFLALPFLPVHGQIPRCYGCVLSKTRSLAMCSKDQVTRNRSWRAVEMGTGLFGGTCCSTRRREHRGMRGSYTDSPQVLAGFGELSLVQIRG